MSASSGTSQIITHREFMELLTRRRKQRSLREFAEELGVSFQFLSQVMNGKCAPGQKLAQALGYEQVTGFQKRKRGKDR